MNTPISSLMSSPVSSVGMDDTVEAIESLMTRKRISWVPVIGPDGATVGVITSSDLLQFHLRKQDPTTVHAWLVCSYKPITVDAATSVVEVARLMLERRIHHVVVTQYGCMVGVVSALDFVRKVAADDERASRAPVGEPQPDTGG
jgi:signal-transduction protein with cAMP-binding, CBS, and nucleotidyltransferase domain